MAAVKGTFSKKGGRPPTLGKKSSMFAMMLEERKVQLYEKQSLDYAEWIAAFLRCDPLRPDLASALQNGAILLHLVKSADSNKLKDVKLHKLSDHVNQSQAQLNLAQFSNACDILGIPKEDQFDITDLLTGNLGKILRTLQILRKMIEENARPAASSSSSSSAEPSVSTIPSDMPPLVANGADTMALKRLNSHTRNRSIRLFDGLEPPPLERRGSNGPIIITRGFSRDFDLSQRNLPTDDVIPLEPEEIQPEKQPEVAEPREPQETSASASKDVKQASEESEESEESDDESGEEFEETNPEFVDPLTPNIMAHLLSKHIPHEGSEDYTEDSSEEEEESSEEEEEISEEEYARFETMAPAMVAEQDELIKTLSAENERLQELFEAEIIARHKEADQNKELLETFTMKIKELEERSQQAETRARAAESNAQAFKTALEERDKSVALLSKLNKDREADLYTANIRLIQLAERLQKSESHLSTSISADSISSMDRSPPPLSPVDGLPPRLEIELPTTPEPQTSPSTEPLPEINIPKIEEPPFEKRDALRFVVAKKSGKRRSVLISPMEYLKSLEDLTNPRAPTREHPKPIISIEETEQYRMWKQHPDVIPILPNLTSNEIDRQEILYELIGTETSYNRDLDLMIRRFFNPLKELIGSPKFTGTDFRNIFLNLETIVKVNHTLLVDLQERSKAQWPTIDKIGDIILKHAPFFDCYAEYCGDQQRSVKEMKRAEADSQLIKMHLDAMLIEKECRKLDIYAFLLLPMQRVTKYPLLLKTLLKKTPETHPDYEYIKAAQAEIDRTIKAINDFTRRRDDIVHILSIERQLDCSMIKTPINLSNSQEKGRQLIREGLLTRLRLKSRRLSPEKSQGRKLEKLYLFFFSDMLIVTKQFRSNPDGPARYIVQIKPLRYSEIAVRNVPDATNGIGAKNIFLVSSQSTGTLVLQASSSEEKSQWMNDFRTKDLIVKSLLKLETVDMGHKRGVLDEMALDSPSLLSPDDPETPLQRSISVQNRVRPASLLADGTGLIDASQIAKDEKKQSWLQGFKKPEGFLDIKVEELSKPEFDGWLKVLTKGAFQRGSWKWRYCVLKDFSLYFFLSDDHDARATSILLLPGYSTVAQNQPNKKNVFELQHPTIPGSRVLFSGDTPEYMNIWIEALTHATLSRIVPRTFWL